jgi:hypothetical protein
LSSLPPRAIGAFRHARSDVIAWPADYLTFGMQSEWVTPEGSVAEGLRRLDMGAKEWMGLIAYRLTDRTDEFLPGRRYAKQ